MANKIKIRRSSAKQKIARKITKPPISSLSQKLLGQAIAFDQAGRFAEAETLYRQVLQVDPRHPDAWYFLGRLANQFGKNDIAIELIRKALRYKPDFVAAHNSLGIILNEEGRLAEAVASFRHALALKPDHFRAHNNLGRALIDRGDLEEAIVSLHQALAIEPSFAEAYNNLGIALAAQGKPAEAVPNYRRACTLKPDYAEAHSNLLMCLNYLTGQSASRYLDEAHHYGRNATERVRAHFTDWRCVPQPERLRVGLVSGDLRNHPVGYFLENVFVNIDKSQIELLAYPTQSMEDELTKRFRSHFDVWRPLAGKNDEEAARLIHADGVHILLDLSGHTAHNRLPLFAWKPAPVQASWLGYFASTGVAEMDYLIADPVSVPEHLQKNFTERIWYLPETRLCFSPPASAEELPSTSLPALHNGTITFGCFQNLAKINNDVLAAWGRIFNVLPQARLRLQNKVFDSQEVREQIRERLTRSGIAPQRVMLEKPVPRMDYLAAHAAIDIILDTFPFPGGTTTCEALWMGVPTVTLAGDTMIARQGASLLSCAGLSDWIAVSIEDYVAKVLAHTADLEKLAELRAGLREQVLASPVFDGFRFARNFVEGLWGMWNCFLAEHH